MTLVYLSVAAGNQRHNEAMFGIVHHNYNVLLPWQHFYAKYEHSKVLHVSPHSLFYAYHQWKLPQEYLRHSLVVPIPPNPQE